MIVPAFWCLSPNFGDALTPYLVKKIFNADAAFVDQFYENKFIMMTGSMLNWDCPNAVVWGCGIANASDTVPKKDIRLVRGPISCAKTIAEIPDTCPAIGDPALVLPDYYTPKKITNSNITVVPHYVDYLAVKKYVEKFNLDWRIVDLLGPVEDVIDQIVSSEKVYSSSLHGMITANAYGVPAAWVNFSDKIGGDGTKYYDYMRSVRMKDKYGGFFDESNILKLPQVSVQQPSITVLNRVQTNIKNAIPSDVWKT
jgi:pyruvyltransferase